MIQSVDRGGRVVENVLMNRVSLPRPSLKSGLFQQLVLSVFVLVFVIGLGVIPTSAHAANCDVTPFSASGYFFTGYDSATYDANGYLNYHFKISSSFADGRLFRVTWSYADDECNFLGNEPVQHLLTLPSGVTDWSLRFTSATHVDVFDDQNNVVLTGFDVAAFPTYRSVRFSGNIDSNGSTFTSRTVPINQNVVPPVVTGTLSEPAVCPPELAGVAGGSNPYFFDSYEHAEYVDGLLRVHLRLKTPYNDGRGFGSRVTTADSDCTNFVSGSFSSLNTVITAHIRYFSFRMMSATHWQIWDDEDNIPLSCTNCEGDISADTPFVFWSGSIDGNASTIQTTPFSPVEVAPALPACCSNVIFLPGIEGSRLYRPDYNGGTDKLWEPDNDIDVQDSFLNSQGSSIRSDIYAKEKDIIDTTPVGVDIYKPFIQKMDGLKSAGTINDWEPIAYDWRLSLDEILQNGYDLNGRIYYSGDLAATSTPYVVQELRHLAATSQTGKVTIVAHSNGGLLAKRLTEVLGPDASSLIDRIVLVASPQAGTPMALGAGMHGYNQGFPLILNKLTVRAFATTSPMFYNLLPSAQYFTYVNDPVITFDSTLPEWIARYGSVIHSEALLDQFLTDSYGRVNAQTGGSNQPVQMSSSLLNNANTLHSGLDNWVPPNGVDLVQIAGWGIPSTLTGISYTKKDVGVTPGYNSTIDGDGTVVVPSALWTSTTTGVKNYWVDLAVYNKQHLLSTVFGQFIFEHSRIFATQPVDDFIADLIASTTQPIANYTYLSTSAPASTATRLRYALHSPLTLNLYDDLGHHTGVSTTTGQIEQQIPGTYYSELGDVKYIFTEASNPGHIVMNGYDIGTFTLNVDQFQGDTPSGGAVFTDIPTTPQTTANLDVQSDLTTLSTIRVDSNSDGQIDTFVPSDGDVLSIEQLFVNLTTAVNGLTIKANLKTQLLNKITNIQKKIDKQKQKQSNVLAKLQVQVQKQAGKGKIDATIAADISNLLDGLLAQSATGPLDSVLIQQLTDQINTANITQALKTSLLKKIAQLQNLAGITKSLAGFTQTITKKGSKGQIPDADVQNILNLLDQIQSALS